MCYLYNNFHLHELTYTLICNLKNHFISQTERAKVTQSLVYFKIRYFSGQVVNTNSSNHIQEVHRYQTQVHKRRKRRGCQLLKCLQYIATRLRQCSQWQHSGRQQSRFRSRIWPSFPWQVCGEHSSRLRFSARKIDSENS